MDGYPNTVAPKVVNGINRDDLFALIEGVRMDPDVSEPSANGTKPAATALPDPLEEPPDQRVRSQGFNPGPNIDAAGKR